MPRTELPTHPFQEGQTEAHPDAFHLRGSSQTLGTETTFCTAHMWTQETYPGHMFAPMRPVGRSRMGVRKGLLPHQGQGSQTSFNKGTLLPHESLCKLRPMKGGQGSGTQKRGEGPDLLCRPCSSQPLRSPFYRGRIEAPSRGVCLSSPSPGMPNKAP